MWDLKKVKNKVIQGDCLTIMKDIPDNSIDLIISDPPYWKVISEKWDYEWRTKQDYINWFLNCLTEFSRVLRYGGSFYLFGYFKILTSIVPYFGNFGLELKQQIVIDKGIRAIAGRATRNYKQFPTVTESILFIVKDNKKFIKPFLKKRQETLGIHSKDINNALGMKINGGGMWSIYTGDNVCEQFPTKEVWEKLQTILNFDLNYKNIVQTFNSQMGLTDVWRDIDFYKEKRLHPTQKPVELFKYLIETYTNEENLVLDSCSGSGTSAIASLETKRNYICIEKEQKYVDIANKRIQEHISIF